MTLLGRIGMAAVLAAGLMGWSAPGQAQEADQDSALDAVRSLQNALGAPEEGQKAHFTTLSRKGRSSAPPGPSQMSSAHHLIQRRCLRIHSRKPR